MKKLILSAALVAVTTGASAQVLVSANFETNQASLFTLSTFDQGAANDFSVAFEYDYVAAGVPLAPNSTSGQTKGLQIIVNSGDATGQPAAVNALINLSGANQATLASEPRYILKFDVYGSAPTGAAASSEFFYYGSSTGTSTLWGGGLTTATWNGFGFGQTIDGGFSSDYVYYEGLGTGANGYYPHNPRWWGVPTSANPADSLPTTAIFNNSNNEWTNFLDTTTTLTTVAGVARNTWLTVELEVVNGTTANVYFTPIGKSRTLVSDPAGVTIGNGPLREATPGTAITGIEARRPFIGYADINTSISPTTVHAIFDNVQVLIPLPVLEAENWNLYE